MGGGELFFILDPGVHFFYPTRELAGGILLPVTPAPPWLFPYSLPPGGGGDRNRPAPRYLKNQ